MFSPCCLAMKLFVLFKRRDTKGTCRSFLKLKTGWRGFSGCLCFWEITISKGKRVILNREAILREPLLIKDLFVSRSGRVSKLSSKASVESRSVPSLKVSFFNLSFLFSAYSTMHPASVRHKKAREGHRGHFIIFNNFKEVHSCIVGRLNFAKTFFVELNTKLN